MKVIFLDFDGVINNCGFKDDYVFCSVIDRTGLKRYVPFSAQNIEPLKGLITFVLKQEIKIVLSTSWRQIIHYKDFDSAIKEFFGFTDADSPIVINETPLKHGFFESLRGIEINDYLELHKEVTDYVIIDDNYDFLKNQNSHVILTDADKGFTNENLAEVKKKFLAKRFFKN